MDVPSATNITAAFGINSTVVSGLGISARKCFAIGFDLGRQSPLLRRNLGLALVKLRARVASCAIAMPRGAREADRLCQRSDTRPWHRIGSSGSGGLRMATMAALRMC